MRRHINVLEHVQSKREPLNKKMLLTCGSSTFGDDMLASGLSPPDICQAKDAATEQAARLQGEGVYRGLSSSLLRMLGSWTACCFAAVASRRVRNLTRRLRCLDASGISGG